MAEIKVKINEIKIFDDNANERLVYIKYNNYICGIFDTFDEFCNNDELISNGLDKCIDYLLSNRDNFVFDTKTNTLILKNKRCAFTFPMTEL